VLFYSNIFLYIFFQINCFILVSVIYVLLKKTMVKAGGENSSRKSNTRRSMKVTVVLLPLLGLTWVFGFMAVDKNTIFFHYIFAIANSLQVFFSNFLDTERKRLLTLRFLFPKALQGNLKNLLFFFVGSFYLLRTLLDKRLGKKYLCINSSSLHLFGEPDRMLRSRSLR